MLEGQHHKEAVFATLTYAPEHLPPGGTLVPRDMQLFLKRLRARLYPREVRFFGVGEYGDHTSRPHYHLVLFGVGLRDSRDIADCWPLGLTHVGSVTAQSCGYVAGYTTKKMTAKNDPRLQGRHPEFARMSRNPGIGFRAAGDIGESLSRSSAGAAWVAKNGDVPAVTRMDGRFFPLGRYMVSKIREACGFGPNAPDAKKALYLESMRALREAVGNAAFYGAKAYVDWSKVDSVIARANARAKLSRKPL